MAVMSDDVMNAVGHAFEESRRELESQETDVDALRTRASFVLAAAGISAGTVMGTLVALRAGSASAPDCFPCRGRARSVGADTEVPGMGLHE